MWAAALGLSAVILAFPQDATGSCDMWVDGGKYRFMVPAHFAWDELWTRADRALESTAEKEKFANELGVTPAAFEQIFALGVARETIAPLASGFAHYPAMLAAEKSLEARDRLLESVDAASAARVRAWVDKASAKPYPMGIQGELEPAWEGGMGCATIVHARTHPHLMPEWDVWSTFFLFNALGAEHFRQPDGTYADTYLTAQQQHRFRMSKPEIARLLDLSIKTHALEQSLNENPGLEPIERFDARIDAVMNARWLLRTAFPETTWPAVVAEIQKQWLGHNTGFPPYRRER